MYKKVVAALAGIALTTLVATPAVADSWRDEQYWLEDYGFTEAWNTTMGQGVTIGVIDTGIDGSHQDLSGQVVGGYDASRSEERRVGKECRAQGAREECRNTEAVKEG